MGVMKLKPAKTDKEFQKAKAEFSLKFYRLMLELGLYNKFNRTYSLQIIEKKNYGLYAHLYLEPGLTFTELEKKIDAIQQNLCCIWIMKTESWREYAEVEIVIQPLDEKLPYVNPEVKPWQMYMGLNFTLSPIINDNNKHHMFLLAGAIGAGKTRFIYQILLSWILGCSPEEVEIYLCDIAKNEFVNFQYVKHIKYYASELEELHEMMQHIKAVIEKRKQIITRCREKGTATNIKEFNTLGKKILSYCYIVIDEFSVVVPDKSDSPREKEMKEEIIDILKKVSKIGRSLGIFTVICLQKTTKEEMGASILKNMSAVRISFRANDFVSSEVIIGSGAAVGLADRYAVYSQNGGDKKDYLFSPNLSTELLNSLLEPYIDRKHIAVERTAYLPKQVTQYNPDADPENAPRAWKLEVRLKPLDEVLRNKAPRIEKKVINLKGGDYIDY